MSRWYGLPSWSYAGHSDSKLLDEQWSLELGVGDHPRRALRATLLHDVGYLESGLQSALEGMVLGDEMVGYARALLDAVEVGDDDVALDEVRVAGPGGNHLGSKMTRARHRGFWQPALIDQNTHDRWVAHDGRTLLERVRARLHDLLASPPAFSLDADADAELQRLAAARPAAS